MNKDKIISIRVKSWEHDLIKAKARKSEQNMSEYIKDIVLQARIDKSTAKQIIPRLSNIESALNIMKLSEDNKDEYQAIRQEVQSIWRTLK